MRLSLIICTYMRPKSLVSLLNSIEDQSTKPNEVIIVDGSINNETQYLIDSSTFSFHIKFFLVDPANRGLTLQRNFGITKVNPNSDLVSFLDDDLILESKYFDNIISIFKKFDNAIGVGGIDLIENNFLIKEANSSFSSFNYYEFDGWVAKEPLRYKLRKILGLMKDIQPGIVPPYGHGRSDFPPNGKTYEVDHFMGGIATYKILLFKDISFSKYFQGYGLYEDFDFCVRSLKFGKLYINTAAQVWHYHDESGRPNFFKYGKMVVRNGWYVWKLRFANISTINVFKWHIITLLLANLRLANFILGPDRKKSFLDYCGRMVGWFSLFFDPPKLEK